MGWAFKLLTWPAAPQSCAAARIVSGSVSGVALARSRRFRSLRARRVAPFSRSGGVGGSHAVRGRVRRLGKYFNSRSVEAWGRRKKWWLPPPEANEKASTRFYPHSNAFRRYTTLRQPSYVFSATCVELALHAHRDSGSACVAARRRGAWRGAHVPRLVAVASPPMFSPMALTAARSRPQ